MTTTPMLNLMAHSGHRQIGRQIAHLSTTRDSGLGTRGTSEHPAVWSTPAGSAPSRSRAAFFFSSGAALRLRSFLFCGSRNFHGRYGFSHDGCCVIGPNLRHLQAQGLALFFAALHLAEPIEKCVIVASAREDVEVAVLNHSLLFVGNNNPRFVGAPLRFQKVNATQLECLSALVNFADIRI